MVCDICDPHRLESACTDVQCDLRGADTALFKLGQHGFVEMQPRRGRRNRTGLAGIYGLVALLVKLIRAVLDIRRQRHRAVLFENVRERGFSAEMQHK